MQSRFRLVAMVLVITLAGGAQACQALCATPAKPAQTAKATPKKSACHGCPVQTPSEPAPTEPTAPCKQCQTSSQERLAAERDGSLLKTASELTFLPFVELTPEAPAVARSSFEVAHPSVHSPPGERLHQFCLLLI